jgi:hypothetical protein
VDCNPDKQHRDLADSTSAMAGEQLTYRNVYRTELLADEQERRMIETENPDFLQKAAKVTKDGSAGEKVGK